MVGVRGEQAWMRWNMALPPRPLFGRNGECDLNEPAPVGPLLVGDDRGEELKRSEKPPREKHSKRGLCTGVLEFFSSCGMCRLSAIPSVLCVPAVVSDCTWRYRERIALGRDCLDALHREMGVGAPSWNSTNGQLGSLALQEGLSSTYMHREEY